MSIPEPKRRNEVAIRMRMERGWSQRRQASEMQRVARDLGIAGLPASRDTIIKEISRVESGQIAVPDAMYSKLWCTVFDCDPSDLFGHLDAPAPDESTAETYAVTSHKFIPAHLGCTAIHKLWEQASPDETQWGPCRRLPLQHPTGTATLYLWPIGVAVIHLAEELEPRSIAELAVWRRTTYPQSQAWGDAQLTEILGTRTETAYVLSVYWLARPKWSGPTLDAAVRLLSMPTHLLDREDATCGNAELLSAGEMVERELLRDLNVDRNDLVPFGARGVSVGYASWSSVAYHPTAPRRALAVDEIVRCELMVQAIWCYTHAIAAQIEAGEDPIVPAAYGWRFLRGIRSKLTAPRATETGQHHSMREAIIATSDLEKQLNTAINALRESENSP